MALTELPLVLRVEVAQDTVNLLPNVLREQPRIAALMRGIGDVLQDAELLHFRLLDERTLDNATGIHLNHWGERVGEKRGSLQDQDYRRFIQARIQALGWAPLGGTTAPIDGVISILGLVGQCPVRYFPKYHAGFKLVLYRSAWLGDEVADRVVRLMLDLRPAGVSLTLVEALGVPFGPGTGGMSVGAGLLSRRLYP